MWSRIQIGTPVGHAGGRASTDAQIGEPPPHKRVRLSTYGAPQGEPAAALCARWARETSELRAEFTLCLACATEDLLLASRCPA
ncbi:major facilitator superfamily protein [Anopheles sinensis]|uniref:Major facilitator superfamily protein n=1 Tax=Anopheles sinensis TaxID=74873 RepID=A0A084WFH8_ANOSI|nr:major facilitator superfamily protein [Anopheles sinensis]